jgi:hypothetical protein
MLGGTGACALRVTCSSSLSSPAVGNDAGVVGADTGAGAAGSGAACSVSENCARERERESRRGTDQADKKGGARA